MKSMKSVGLSKDLPGNPWNPWIYPQKHRSQSDGKIFKVLFRCNYRE